MVHIIPICSTSVLFSVNLFSLQFDTPPNRNTKGFCVFSLSFKLLALVAFNSLSRSPLANTQLALLLLIAKRLCRGLLVNIYLWIPASKLFASDGGNGPVPWEHFSIFLLFFGFLLSSQPVIGTNVTAWEDARHCFWSWVQFAILPSGILFVPNTLSVIPDWATNQRSVYIK